MRILVSTDYEDIGGMADSPRTRPNRPKAKLGMSIVRALRATGAIPLLVPPGEPRLEELLAWADGVVISGGNFDIHPSHYGQRAVAELGAVVAERTSSELLLARMCLERDIPVLGVCGGMQAMAVAAGGSLIQDIGTQVPGAQEHEQPTDPAQGWHRLRTEGGIVGALLGRHPVVNSTHHQAVDTCPGARVSARAEDGVIEAIEYPNHPFAVGVQWHPELLDHAERVYGALVEAAGRR